MLRQPITFSCREVPLFCYHAGLHFLSGTQDMATSPTNSEPNKVIYSMIGVYKKIDKKVLLKDIYLSYFYGAKIGVLGINGAGKSTLLKILAGVDKEFDGEIQLAPGYTTGFLEQKPQLDPEKTVREIVQE